MRRHISFGEEAKDLLIADLVLALAFDFLYNGGITSFAKPIDLAIFFPICIFASSLSMVPHELMHKKVAMRYGAIAAFRKSNIGLALTLISGFFGFLIGLPGATVIYKSYFSKEEEGITSLAGPLTNFSIAIVLFASRFLVGSSKYLGAMFYVAIYICLLLALFNMLPLPPLDGSKVLSWNKKVYFGTLALFFLSFAVLVSLSIAIELLVFMLFFGLIFYFLYRGFTL
ncbi:MAG: site-2 protease family protein [Candidatus Micrarchaeaceae archaeon]